MDFRSRSVSATVTPSPVVIDWSGDIDSSVATDENIEKMISWIRTYPRRGDIHVYVGKPRQREVGRKLQCALQALGCRVTTKQYCANA